VSRKVSSPLPDRIGLCRPSLRFVAAIVSSALLQLGAVAPAHAGDLVVFAAASLTDVVTELAASFEARGNPRVRVSFGASSDLARQIRSGAPADVFLSADERQMQRLIESGDVLAEDRRELLSNTLVVVVPAGDPRALAGPGDLLGFRRLALADPELVPAGVYARLYLEQVGLWERLSRRVVPTLDVRAALAAVAAEHAPAGIVYRTDAATATRVRIAYAVPPGAGPRITYVMAPLAAARSELAVRRLVAELCSPGARQVYVRHGFIPLFD
jgi:molybdate transport system substrate-binding protein